jgi:hypothetical protein
LVKIIGFNLKLKLLQFNLYFRRVINNQTNNQMKKIILALTLFISVNSISQAQSSGKEEEATCYSKWVKKFEERGAMPVTDGTYGDVIITIRSAITGGTNCFMGKCDVKDGKVIAMYMKLEDGKYEPIQRKPKYEQSITITNGISKTFITFDEDLINVLFTNKLKPKKAEFQKAPDPDDE